MCKNYSSNRFYETIKTTNFNKRKNALKRKIRKYLSFQIVNYHCINNGNNKKIMVIKK